MKINDQNCLCSFFVIAFSNTAFMLWQFFHWSSFAWEDSVHKWNLFQVSCYIGTFSHVNPTKASLKPLKMRYLKTSKLQHKITKHFPTDSLMRKTECGKYQYLAIFYHLFIFTLVCYWKCVLDCLKFVLDCLIFGLDCLTFGWDCLKFGRTVFNLAGITSNLAVIDCDFGKIVVDSPTTLSRF